MQQTLHDGHGRRFDYLRLSLTDVCNFRCSYCLPDGYRRQADAPPNLTVDEVRRLVAAFARLGLWKVRLTGGEPSLRRELIEIASAISQVPGVRRLAMTTNGYRLAERARDYAAAGINALNISVDSLDPARFAAITGHDRLGEVLAGIAAARAAGIGTVKLNSVLMRGINDLELEGFVAFVDRHDLSLRFIEVMRTNDNTAFFKRHHMPGAEIAATPEDDGSTHYFFCTRRNHIEHDGEYNAFKIKAMHDAFWEEDGPLIAAAESEMGGEDFFALNPMLLSNDLAAVKVRRRLRDLVGQEAE